MIHLARILIASLFILGGINKIINYTAVLDSMVNAGLPVVGVLLPLTIILELVGGIIVAVGARYYVPAALVLAVFTAATNVVFSCILEYGSSRASHRDFFIL